ncbi:MAG: lyase family protein [Litoreibacter sp.]
MATSLFDSPLYRDLFHDGEVGKLFSDSAEVRAMMIVEGALARAQAQTGVIPEISAAAIARAAMETQIDPGALTKGTGQNAVPVPAFVAAFREEMNAPEHAQYLHFGATSQDIMDTALMLRMRQVLSILADRLSSILTTLANIAETHAHSPIAGRTYGQTATLTSYGAVAASWGNPLITLRTKLPQIQEEALCVSLSGAAGTLSALGDKGLETRAAFAQMTGLGDPGRSWHTDRVSITSLASWMTQVTTSLGKIGEDLILMSASGISEITLGTAGSSSTMPQKQNPVQPSVLVSLSQLSAGLNATLLASSKHRQQRDGVAWMTEWLTFPQLCMATAKATATADAMLGKLSPDTGRMLDNAEDHLGLIYAEALSFALSQTRPRPEAQAQVKALCQQARAENTPLKELAFRAFSDLPLIDVFTPAHQLGLAPHEATDFAKRARET